MKTSSLLWILPSLLLSSLSAVPTNVALNQPAVASSVLSSSYPSSNAVDGNNSADTSRWLSTDTSPPHWIELELGQTYSLSQLKFWTGHATQGDFPLDDYALQFWDGTGWTDLYSVTGSTDDDGAVDVLFGPTVSGNRVRLNITAVDPFNGDNIVRLYELEIYGEAHGLTYTGLFPEVESTLIDLTADLSVTFNDTLSAVDLSGLRIENLDTSTDVAGVSGSISGNSLLISHGGLAPSTNYAVHVPGARVALASDAGVQNGAITWEFTTAPLKPTLVSYTNELPGLSGDLDFVFDRDISLAVPSGITIKRASDSSLVTGISASASGNTLTLSHDAFVAEEAYIVIMDADVLTADINGLGNDALRRVVFAGNINFLNADFTTDADGFQFADDWFTPAENWWQVWRRSDGSAIGPDNDDRFLVSRTNWKEDFTVSPVLSLIAGQSYTLRFRADLERTLSFGYVPATAVPGTGTEADVLAAATVVGTTSSGGPKTVIQEFTPASSGDYHMIFFSGDTLANSDQQIDAISLTRVVAPVVSFISPAPAASFLESDGIAVEVEAYGVSAGITDVSLYDDGALIGSMTKTGDVYTFDWDYHAPGTRTLSAVATDALGNTSSSEIPITITFDDGSLDTYVGWDFDDGNQNWIFSVGGSKIRVLDSTDKPGKDVRVNSGASDLLAISSPQVSLLAGETYTLQFDAKRWDSSNSFVWSFLPTAIAGYPADFTGKIDFTINTNAWNTFEINFSVPTAGAYHLTLFRASTSGYQKVAFDDVRIIGNLNSVPVVSLTQPSGNVTTIAGATLNLAADATDVDGSISLVEFREQGGGLLEPDAFDSSAPYTYAWENLPAGTFDIVARAIDNNSASRDSNPRTVTVAQNQYSISTFLGGSTTDEAFTGAAYLSDGTLVMSGIIDPNLFPGVTPVYLNGTTVGDRGVVARLSEDGQTCLSVTVVGTRALDIDTDASDRIFVAAGDDGAVVLNSTASSVLWSNDYGAPHVHRIDAAEGGTFALITSSTFDYLDEKINSGTNHVYDSSYTQLGSMGGIGAFTTDVAVDEATQTVVFIGWKNITDMEGPSGDPNINPVDIPGIAGRAYDGTLKWRAYDWEKEASGDRFLNLITNNMADTRGSRVIVGPDGKLYAGIEFDGGNTPLRYDPFDITLPVSVVGGDNYHSMSNTSTVPKTFVGRYDPGTGAYETGQWITNRLSSGNDNTIRIKNGNLMVDTAGRIHVVGGSASGLPLTHDPLSGINYSGGAYHLVYSPDFTSREYVTRLTPSSGNLSHYAGIAQSPSGTIATSGRTNSPLLFDVNPWQSTLHTAYDAHFAVGDLDPYYKFQTGDHPRLFFDSAGLDTIRARLGTEPYASMYANLVANRDYAGFYRLYDAGNSRELFSRAQGSAFIYALSGDEAYAQDARDDIETALGLIGADWADPGIKGLDLYAYATELAMCYDLCAASDAWDAAFNFQMSKRLVDIAEIIVNNGGTEQPSSLASNWKAARGASAAIAFLATDHNFVASLADTAEGFVQNYLNNNQLPGSVGWNAEGFGYTAFAIGNYVGPYGVAADRDNGTTAYRDSDRLEGMTWSGFAGATTAYNIFGLGGVKTDWSDDNPHTGGEGTYGLAFYYADAELKRGIRHAYDRFMGPLSPFGPNWDGAQQGSFWSILYYPDEVVSQDPTEIWDWHRRSTELAGTGTFTYRNSYANEDDILVQFKAKLDDIGQAHDGPDGLGFRLIGLDDAFVVGGGRDSPGLELNQATVYPQDPDLDFSWKKKTGSLVGTPLLKPDGSGHVIAAMAENNVGTFSHKRWFVADFDTASTGADATIIVADTSANGLYWQLPTFLQNSVADSGNTFTITGTQGATLRGTILHPGGSPTITIGTKARGSHYGLENGGTLATEDPVTNPRIEENRYLHIQGTGDGDFLIIMTLVDSAGSHPAVSHVSGGVADAVVQVGNKNYALQSEDVLYSTGTDTPAAYSAPNATVTFDADGKGSLGGAAVQSVAYGGSAIAPTVSPDPGYTFMGWNKAFAQVVTSMTVTALYDASAASGFTSWIADPLYSLDPGDQDPGDNPDFDPYDNLMEYALVLNPSLPDGAGVISVREESGSLILSYRVRDGATDITVTPKYASDLSGTWTDIPGGNISPTGSGPNYTEYEASMPIGSGPLFLILEVTQ